MLRESGLFCVALALGAITAVSAGERQATDANKTAPDRQIVFKVQGLTCPAVKGLGCGGRLVPVFARLAKIGGIEQTLSNLPGTMIRVSIAAAADREKVAKAVLKDLTEDDRSPLRLNGDELKQVLAKEQWRLPDELSSIELRTLALDRVKGFADAEKLGPGVTDKLLQMAGEQWDRLAKPADAKHSHGNTDWTALRAEFTKALDEQTKELHTTDQRERLKKALTSRWWVKEAGAEEAAKRTSANNVDHRSNQGRIQTPTFAAIKYSIGIEGMTCDRCSARAQKELAAVPGVVEASVDYKTGHAWVTVKETQTKTDAGAQPQRISTKIAEAVTRAGANHGGGFKPTVNYVLSIRGMTCESCSQQVQSALAKVSGVAKASVSYKDGAAIVIPSAGAKDGLSKNVIAAVKESGYEAVVHSGP